MTANLPVAYNMGDIEKMAGALVKSRLFGIDTIEQAVTLMLVAQSEGLHPAMAARDYHIIQGRPSMKADTMMARFQQAGGKVEWQDYTDLKVGGLFSHPQSPKPVLIEWTIEMAKRIGLANKDNWKKYPRQMLRARVISEGVRTVYPAIASGIYASEEMQDFEPARGAGAGSVGAITADRRSIVAETAAQIRSYMKNDQAFDAYSLLESIGDSEERMALWSMLDSRIRASLTAMQDAEKAQAAGGISEAQHKRLEARIREMKFDRDGLKQYCLDNFNKAHFPDLTQAEYRDVDLYLDAHVSVPQPTLPTAESPSAQAGGADQLSELIARGEKEADWGTENYAKWWKALTKEERASIGADEHARFKAIAAESDANAEKI